MGLYPELGHDASSKHTDPAKLPVRLHSQEFPHDTVYPITAACPRLKQLQSSSTSRVLGGVVGSSLAVTHARLAASLF